MHARVVRFTDVTPERIEEIRQRVDENDGPPEGVEATGMQLLVDENQGTALFVGYFADPEKMDAASRIFEQMDASETPGTRQSVDQCEVLINRDT
jgi:hypothetical protein